MAPSRTKETERGFRSEKIHYFRRLKLVIIKSSVSKKIEGPQAEEAEKEEEN
jgi:hypothetical protein